MLATEILTKEHRKALKLIGQLEGAKDGTGTYAKTFGELEDALNLHIREEEEIYYPALAQYEEFSDLLEENVPEHEMVKQNLAQLGELVPNSAEFQELLQKMKTALQEHMTREEDEIFPDSIDVLGRKKIEMLGEQIEDLKMSVEFGQSASV